MMTISGRTRKYGKYAVAIAITTLALTSITLARLQTAHAQSGISISNSDVHIPQTPVTSVTTSVGLKVVFGIAGGVAFIIAIVSGLRLVLTQGDPAAVNRARSAFIFAIVGLVVIVTAYSIVNFVLDKVG